MAPPPVTSDETSSTHPPSALQTALHTARLRAETRQRERLSNRRVSRSSKPSSSSPQDKVFPKRGRTRIPSHLISKRAVTDLGYAFKEEGDVIIIPQALGRENIDEVIKLSETYVDRRPNKSHLVRKPSAESLLPTSASSAHLTVGEGKTKNIPKPPDWSDDEGGSKETDGALLKDTSQYKITRLSSKFLGDPDQPISSTISKDRTSGDPLRNAILLAQFKFGMQLLTSPAGLNTTGSIQAFVDQNAEDVVDDEKDEVVVIEEHSRPLSRRRNAEILELDRLSLESASPESPESTDALDEPSTARDGTSELYAERQYPHF